MKISTLEHSFSDTAEPIKQYLEGKVVFDIGAGDGYFAKKMAVYAKEVVAVWNGYFPLLPSRYGHHKPDETRRCHPS